MLKKKSDRINHIGQERVRRPPAHQQHLLAAQRAAEAGDLRQRGYAALQLQQIRAAVADAGNGGGRGVSAVERVRRQRHAGRLP